MPIEIRITSESAETAREEMARLLGSTHMTFEWKKVEAPELNPATDEASDATPEKMDYALNRVAEQGGKPLPPAARKRGEPSPGKTRRTKAEIAEDEAADAADASGVTVASFKRLPDDATPEQVAKEFAAISTGENRVDPGNPEDAAQDEADEQAEVEAGRNADAPVTVDDVKALATAYANTYGMPAAQEDGPKIFKEALGNPPAGENFWRFSILPDDQAALVKLKNIWQRALDENPLKRAKVEG